MEPGATVPVMLSLSVRALLCSVAAAALAGCATGRGAQPTQEAAPARVTLAELKNAQDAQAQEIARLAGDVKAMDAQQAFLVAEIKSLSEQIATLKSSLSETEGALRSLRSIPVPPESRPVAPLVPPPAPALAPEPIPPATPAAKPAAPASAAPARPAPTAPGAPSSQNAEADRMFAAALAKLRAGDVGQAALEFGEFVVEYPAHPQAAVAQNHIGEAYYRQGEYRRAMGEFQKTVDDYTQAAQVSEALLKIGLCQRELGDAARAKASWEQVVKQFPKSDAARQARTLLSSRAPAGR